MAESTSTIALKLPSQYSSATSDSAAPTIDWPSRTWTVTHSTLSIFFTNMDNIFSKEINKNLGGLGRYAGLTMTEKQQQRLLGRASKDDAPTAGVDHLQRLLSFDNDAGLDYFFFPRACLDSDVIAPAGRPGWLTWLIATSPIMARTVELCHQHVHKNRERVVTYSDTAWIQ